MAMYACLQQCDRRFLQRRNVLIGSMVNEQGSSNDIEIATVNRIATVQHDIYSQQLAEVARAQPHILHYAHCVSFAHARISPADVNMMEQYYTELGYV